VIEDGHGRLGGVDEFAVDVGGQAGRVEGHAPFVTVSRVPRSESVT
jgi:hypothetical protein